MFRILMSLFLMLGLLVGAQSLQAQDHVSPAQYEERMRNLEKKIEKILENQEKLIANQEKLSEENKQLRYRIRRN